MKAICARSTDGRKISFEKSAMSVNLKLGAAPSVAKVDEAFISNVPVSEDTPSLLEDRSELGDTKQLEDS